MKQMKEHKMIDSEKMFSISIMTMKTNRFHLTLIPCISKTSFLKFC